MSKLLEKLTEFYNDVASRQKQAQDYIAQNQHSVYGDPYELDRERRVSTALQAILFNHIEIAQLLDKLAVSVNDNGQKPKEQNYGIVKPIKTNTKPGKSSKGKKSSRRSSVGRSKVRG